MQLPKTGNATSIAAGAFHTCAITRTGGVKCWGSNRGGQLGNGSYEDSTSPVDVIGLSGGVTALTAGYTHTCAITRAGAVVCWGENAFKQLDSRAARSSPRPIDITGLGTGVRAIAAGTLWTCAITNAGGIKCWGYGRDGNLGNGETTDNGTPVDVSGLSRGIRLIAAGGDHTCAVLVEGSVKCWGANSNGQLGDGTTMNRSIPVDVQGLAGPAMALAAGPAHTCAILRAGRIVCWGYNREGQLGDGETADSGTPVDVKGFTGPVIAIATGTFEGSFGGHTCALTAEGAVRCWGINSAGQLGTGSRTNSGTPVDVLGLGSGVAAIAVNQDHSCAMTRTGVVVCWGSNTFGQLGDGFTTDSSIPGVVDGL